MINNPLTFSAIGALTAYLLWPKTASAQTNDSNFVSELATQFTDMILPRGIRNNNPGNILLTSTVWEGMRDIQTDGTYIQFISPEYGIRAMGIVLRTYFYSYGLNTVQKIISRWSSTDVESYIKYVSDKLGVTSGQTLNYNYHLKSLIITIISFENGYNPYSDDTINGGIAII